MRMMGIDYGDKKAGIALSDELGIIASGLEVIFYNHDGECLEKLIKIIETYKVTKIVLGMPKNMNGTIGIRGEKTKGFAEKVNARLPDIPIIMWDERLTTAVAKKIMIETQVKKKNKKKTEDKIAAVLILQSYLDSLK